MLLKQVRQVRRKVPLKETALLFFYSFFCYCISIATEQLNCSNYQSMKIGILFFRVSGILVSHSHTTKHFHPNDFKDFMFNRSLSEFLESFLSQYSLFQICCRAFVFPQFPILFVPDSLSKNATRRDATRRNATRHYATIWVETRRGLSESCVL